MATACDPPGAPPARRVAAGYGVCASVRPAEVSPFTKSVPGKPGASTTEDARRTHELHRDVALRGRRSVHRLAARARRQDRGRLNRQDNGGTRHSIRRRVATTRQDPNPGEALAARHT